MQRINVIGTSGSGKSTFARKLANRLDMLYIEMDAINWKPNWQEAAPDVFLHDLNSALTIDKWVLDGNYSRASDLKWQRADTIIWLDYGFFSTFYQIIKRSIKRAWKQEEVWEGTGNKESFRRSFFSSDSVIHWMLISYRRNKKRYAKLMQEPPFQHIQCIRIRSPKEASIFFETLTKRQIY